MKHLISVEEAREIILSASVALEPVLVSIDKAVGLVLAEDVFAPIDMPSFRQSNMDGYAFAFEEGATQYILSGKIAAGDSAIQRLSKGTAVRIFTGAPLPEGADTVIMQEKTEIAGDKLLLKDPLLKKASNVREKGADIGRGTKAISANTRLTPTMVAFLASVGLTQVKVFPRPRVGILVTGNELQTPGKSLSFGQVYESNSFSLRAALKQLHIESIEIRQSLDDINQLSSQLSDLINQSDLILMVGGVSVGEYDFTVDAFKQAGVDILFHKIRQKPGKPLLFGKKDKKLVFGLPGNPGSVMTCFYEYVVPAIGYLTKQVLALEMLEVPLETDFQKPAGLAFFQKAYFNKQTVSFGTGQESFKLSGFVHANCLAYIPENITSLKVGEMVTIHLLPS